jgi:hypothetical protein
MLVALIGVVAGFFFIGTFGALFLVRLLVFPG